MELLDLFYDRFLLSSKKKKYRLPGIKDCKVGNTPLIRLFHYSSNYDRLIYGKMECENPTRSAKDRVAEFIINKGIEEGKINSNSTIIEASSGNTGLAIARIAKLKGLKCIIAIKDKVSKNKIDDLIELGAETIVCDSKAKRDNPDNYITKAEFLAETIEDAFYVNQNYNPDNTNAHYHTTGPEIWEQTGGAITHLVGAISTGGTLCGTARFLKEQNPNIKVIAVDAVGSVLRPYYETQKLVNPGPSYFMDGVGKKFVPSNVDFSLFDDVLSVSDVEAYKACIELNENESIYVGHSSGAVMKGICDFISETSTNACIVGIFPDHGSKYEQSIFSREWLLDKGFIKK